MQFRKNRSYATINDGEFVTIRATPQDALPDEQKPFYVVDIIRRKGIGSAAYTSTMTTLSRAELGALLGIGKKRIDIGN